MDSVGEILVKRMDEDPDSDPEPTGRVARPRPSGARLRRDTDVALIQCVRARPVLYDAAHSRYMDIQLKNKIWSKIGNQLKINPSTCKTRWNNIRDNYRKSLRRRGLNANTYKFAKHLGFMDRYYKGQPLAARDADSDSHEDKDAAEEPQVTINIKTAPSDNEDQESATDEFERSSVSVTGNQIPVSGPVASQAEAVDAFLAAIATSLKSLSPYHLSLAKAEIFATVHKYELKSIVEGEWGPSDVNPLP